MSRQRVNISAKVLARARKLRAAGTSWSNIGARLGYSKYTLRDRIDPDYAARKRLQLIGFADFTQVDEVRVTPAEAARALATVPLDTRSVAARFLGDPLPGRSALDRKRLGGR